MMPITNVNAGDQLRTSDVHQKFQSFFRRKLLQIVYAEAFLEFRNMRRHLFKPVVAEFIVLLLFHIFAD